MENITPVRKLSFQKKRTKKNINSSKNNNNIVELHSLIPGKNNIDFDLQTKQFHSQVKKRRKAKFNSIDNVSLFFNENNNKSKNKNDSSFSPRKQKKLQKKENNFSNYCENIFLEEPHFKKSVFKKQSNNRLNKNFNRKVSFLSPKGRKNKQALNLIKMNKSTKLNPINLENNNDTKSRIFKSEMGGDEQSYGYDKVYNANLKKITNDDIIKSSIFNKKDFDGRNLKRKQTNKTSKINYSPKIRNLEKKNTTIIFKRNIKKKNTSKSNDKKLKKKSTKGMKDKGKGKETNGKEKNNKNKNLKIININNNININTDDKLEKNKLKKNVTIVDKNDKKYENAQKSNSSETKNKKKQDFSPKKSIENIETLVQAEDNKKINIKKPFCCIPFLICFKNKDENENIF